MTYKPPSRIADREDMYREYVRLMERIRMDMPLGIRNEAFVLMVAMLDLHGASDTPEIPRMAAALGRAASMRELDDDAATELKKTKDYLESMDG